MALIVLGAAKGAPGVTTTTAALAAVWPRDAVLVEADPAGSDLQILLRNPSGQTLRSGRAGAGLMGVATGVSSPTALFDAPAAQDSDLGVPVIVGPPHSRSSRGMGAAWQQIATALLALAHTGDRDVLVDVGRIDDANPAMPLVEHADLVVLVCRRSARGIVHTRTVASILEERMRVTSPNAPAAHGAVLLLDDPSTPSAVQTQWQLAAKGLTRSWPVLASLTHDPASALALFDTTSRHRDINPLMTSIRAAATTLLEQAAAMTRPREDAPAVVDLTAGPLTTTSTAPTGPLPDGSAGQPTAAVTPDTTAAGTTLVSATMAPAPDVSSRPWPPVPPRRRGARSVRLPSGREEANPLNNEPGDEDRGGGPDHVSVDGDSWSEALR